MQTTCEYTTVLHMIDSSDPEWYKAEADGKSGFVPKTYVAQKATLWFEGM